MADTVLCIWEIYITQYSSLRKTQLLEWELMPGVVVATYVRN